MRSNPLSRLQLKAHRFFFSRCCPQAIFFLCALLILMPGALKSWALESEPAAPDLAGVFNLQLENDILNPDSDGYYTHGTRFSYLSNEKIPRWVQDSSAYLPFFTQKGKMRVSYALGQSIFTPNDISRSDLIEDDRPYAGWLYFAVGLLSDRRQGPGRFSNRLDSLELNLGIVGPAALGEQVQTFVHELTNSTLPQGWDHQLENEPGFLLIYDRQWQGQYDIQLNGLELDLSPHVGGALGNVMTYAAAGATLRFGRYLAGDYGAPLIRPSMPGSGFFTKIPGFGWYVFAGLEGRAVLQNIFLDGNTFKDSHSVDKEPLVGDLQAGLVFTWGDYRLSLTNVFRSREFKLQEEPTNFGALSLSVRL